MNYVRLGACADVPASLKSALTISLECYWENIGMLEKYWISNF